ncbi:T9SS type B sorting domain-containing protein [Myroides phaeus]|uniref:Gliding motility-associated C-terminal domain-containing protein n=1 Tax=Myroides phaeus TaxID=702745 RepID=A0A1G8BY53_9FLAO|nr:T9SS type B sorting domain-containing protein [Myroides phaeus]SDH38151.1 gliding motility-associated C-terminal domain-containing protein [Myroides phaeus]
MGKRKWLLLFVLFSFLSVGTVVGGTNPFDYLGKTELAEVYNDQDEQKPEVKVGKPQDLIKCVPSKHVATKFNILLSEALEGKDEEGNDRLPRGYKYLFYDKANSNSPLTSEYVAIDGEPKMFWVRVYSVLDEKGGEPVAFSVSLSNSADCDFNDQLVSLRDMYESGKADSSATFNIAPQYNMIYYGQFTSYEVYRKGINGTSNPEKIAIPSKPDVDFPIVGYNNEVIEIKVYSKDDAKVFGSREFRLHIEEVILDQYSATVEGQIDDTNIDGKNKGTFDLSVVRKQLRASDDSIYLGLDFFEVAKDANGHFVKKAITDITKYVFDEAVVEKVYVSVTDKLLETNPKGRKDVDIKMLFTNRPSIAIPLTNKGFCVAKDKDDEIFVDLTEKNSEALEMIIKEGKDKDDYVVSYHATEEDAKNNVNPLPETYVIKKNNADRIWVRLSEKEGTNFNWSYFYVSVGYSELKTVQLGNSIINFCQTEDFVDLRRLNSSFKGQNLNVPINPVDAKLSVAYYKTFSDAQNDIRMNESDVQEYKLPLGQISDTIYARVIMEEGFVCKAERDDNISKFRVSSNIYPNVSFYSDQDVDEPQLCMNDNGAITPVVLGVKSEDGKEYSTTWYKFEGYYENGSEKWLPLEKSLKDKMQEEISKPGRYRVNVKYKDNPYPAVEACIKSNEWTVKDILVVEVENTDSTGMINSLDVNEQGQAAVVIGLASGTTSGYEFRIDTGAFQPSSHFYNVPIGEHTAWVRDIASGCSAFTTFSVFGYPKFFTPNGDGYNDTWNIPGLQGHPEARIYIYDRYGKLIKQMSPQGEGWDGTFNGKQLPSTDYWFTVEFTTDFVANKELDGRKVSYKGHFSLKR